MKKIDKIDLKKKILFIIPNFSNGGAEKNLIRIINNLDNSLYEFTILCFNKTGNNKDFLIPDANIIDIRIRRIYFSIFKIAKVIKKIKPDIIFSWMGYINAYMAFFIPYFNRNLKWLCRESSIPSFVNNMQKFPWLFEYLYKKYNCYDLIICQSHYMANDLTNNYDIRPEKIKIIHNPIDFKEIEKIKNAVLEKVAGKIYLLYVGGLRIEKRPHLLIEVLALLPEKYILTIIGSGDQYQKVIDTIILHHLQERVIIISDCYNPVPYYERANCLLLTSEFEGFPNVVIESLACGCPAIGFNIKGGSSEALDNYGGYNLQNATLINFADNIISVCEYEHLDKNKVIENCKENYDIKKVIAAYNSILQQ